MSTTHWIRCGACVLLQVAILSGPASAEWKAANPEVAAAARDPKIAPVLDAVNRIDDSLIKDDHAAFQSLLAEDLVVNSPQNAISVQGATGRRNAVGKISYSSYQRNVEYAGVRGDLVLLMGEEVVVPKGDALMSGRQVHRRFTDLWRKDGGRWVLAIRQSTIVASQ